MSADAAAAAPLAGAAALIKSLASCNSSIRAKSLKSLIAWLPTQDQISEDDMKKVWKGLFYCVWHSDKISNQIQLINRLCSLFLSLSRSSPGLSLSYFSHFLLAMRREWPGIDHLRLDKYCLLIRVFLRHLFILLKKKNWDVSSLEKYMGVLEERVLYDVDDKGLGYGVSYHIVSIFCQEIKPYLPLKLEVLNVLFGPFVRVIGRTDNKILVSKVKSDVFDYLVRNGNGLLWAKNSGGEVDPKGEMALFGNIASAMQLSSMFYELGSSPNCVQGNRKVLFELHKSFLKLENDLASSGIDISVPEVSADYVDEEVPTLIAIDGEMNAAHSEADPKSLHSVQEMDDESLDKPSKIGKKGSKSAKSRKAAKKKKKDGLADIVVDCGSDGNKDEYTTISKNENLNGGLADTGNLLTFTEAAISNLQKQFEMVAAEAGMDEDGASSVDSSANQVNGKVTVKRKRGRSVNGDKTPNSELNAERDDVGDNSPRTDGEKSVKKVKFSMKNNLVWKPHSPLPPQSLRLPPSVTPRGSALKKGVPPGPVRETTLERKKLKRKLKKGRKLVKSVSPAIKHVKKLKSLSV
ncbi:hypothetical protein Nepgr_015462 [Nepenthes gracilis]|uniref:Ribosomal RNA processing protein 1 homolog n=1 Tax=Nepenthes gracilis TaxID=150966 RepID=A0AAD3XRB3_NEPGR|nr:hypothetical protein Nepgr_015462 [Nepenthes gracilis]